MRPFRRVKQIFSWRGHGRLSDWGWRRMGIREMGADAIVFIVHTEMHRSPKYWPRPDDFIPERWLVGPEHKLYPRKGSWRAFEHGPRNCIAQDLVMVELSVLLAMVAREFEFRNCYEEWDELKPKKEKKTYRGERAYQIDRASGGWLSLSGICEERLR